MCGVEKSRLQCTMKATNTCIFHQLRTYLKFFDKTLPAERTKEKASKLKKLKVGVVSKHQ